MKQPSCFLRKCVSRAATWSEDCSGVRKKFEDDALGMKRANEYGESDMARELV
jgi:hypothetical protein